jgi:hypothetical protein
METLAALAPWRIIRRRWSNHCSSARVVGIRKPTGRSYHIVYWPHHPVCKLEYTWCVGNLPYYGWRQRVLQLQDYSLTWGTKLRKEQARDGAKKPVVTPKWIAKHSGVPSWDDIDVDEWKKTQLIKRIMKQTTWFCETTSLAWGSKQRPPSLRDCWTYLRQHLQQQTIHHLILDDEAGVVLDDGVAPVREKMVVLGCWWWRPQWRVVDVKAEDLADNGIEHQRFERGLSFSEGFFTTWWRLQCWEVGFFGGHLFVFCPSLETHTATAELDFINQYPNEYLSEMPNTCWPITALRTACCLTRRECLCRLWTSDTAHAWPCKRYRLHGKHGS